MVYTNCSAGDVQHLTRWLHGINATVFCYQIQVYMTFDVIQSMHYEGLSSVVLLLPWYLAEDLIERLARAEYDRITYITIELLPSFINYIQHAYTFLKITNLYSVNLNDLMVRKPNQHMIKL